MLNRFMPNKAIAAAREWKTISAMKLASQYAVIEPPDTKIWCLMLPLFSLRMPLRTDSEIIIHAIAIRRAEFVPENVLFKPSADFVKGNGRFTKFNLKFSAAN